MSSVKEQLVIYGKKIHDAHLVVGGGGNISARDGELVWMKPSGFAMNEMGPDDLCGMRIDTSRQVDGPHKPTSEVHMHLAVYRNRPEINAVFHVHSPWLCGAVSAGVDLAKMPMFAEFINDLGCRMTVPYITPGTQELADAVGNAAKQAETIFMSNHGVCCLGVNMKQAFYRALIVEDAAISLVAAKVIGTPQILSAEQENDLMSRSAPHHRIKVVEQ